MGDFSVLVLFGLLGLLLVSAGIEDVRIREIADWKNGAIALLAPLFWLAIGLPLWPGMALQLALGIGVFALFAVAFHFGMMGGGDVKMLGALALWLPFDVLMFVLIVMSLLGGAITLAMLIEGKLRRCKNAPEIPYGVAIALAGLMVLGEPILNQFPR
ncbi:A24 family peptidase [Sphingomonas japonica]|uniref:Prepilin peptidase CpaA n=1 Tax=Sphingomonas japonica TaxID=511662 RepID=A0ABX0TWN9_9SPHN|nr:prepilin peptidase [Sphingomonas japonica]NIJ22741.1 prepilin peptidase CpaA [Sphingomonas japonica]